MFTADESLLKKLHSFSASFKVTPPQTNNVIEWWQVALQELTVQDFQFVSLAFKAAQQFDLADYFPRMLEMLEERRKSLELLSA